MKIESQGITIHLEQEEITDFVNIIMFARDYYYDKEKAGIQTMTTSELRLSKQLVDILLGVV